jgi:6-pyruvoyltetrahydropterin/6-carboxytetrahydropterin synthase
LYEVGVSARFEAAHSLRGDFGPATRLHGHTYLVDVSAEGRGLRGDGTLCDISRLQATVGEIAGCLHYRNLDEVDELRGLNTTAEALARHFFDRVAATMAGQGVEWVRVRLWESPDAYAGYRGRVPGNDAPSSE